MSKMVNKDGHEEQRRENEIGGANNGGGREGGKGVVNHEVAPDRGLRPDGITDGMETFDVQTDRTAKASPSCLVDEQRTQDR